MRWFALGMVVVGAMLPARLAAASDYVALVRVPPVSVRVGSERIESEVCFFDALRGGMVGRVKTLEVPFCVSMDRGRFIIASVNGSPRNPSTVFSEFDPVQRKVVKTYKHRKPLATLFAPSMGTLGRRQIAYSAGIVWAYFDIGSPDRPMMLIEGIHWKTGRSVGSYKIPKQYSYHTDLVPIAEGCAVIHQPHKAIHGEEEIHGEIVILDRFAKSVSSPLRIKGNKRLWPAMALGDQLIGVTRSGDFVTVAIGDKKKASVEFREKVLKDANVGTRWPRTIGVLASPLDNGGQILLGIREGKGIRHVLLMRLDGRVTSHLELKRPLLNMFILGENVFGLSINGQSLLVMNGTLQLIKEVPLAWPLIIDAVGTQ